MTQQINKVQDLFIWIEENSYYSSKGISQGRWSRGNPKRRWRSIGIGAAIPMLLFIEVADDDDLAIARRT
jgi:hypothetical protein